MRISTLSFLTLLAITLLSWTQKPLVKDLSPATPVWEALRLFGEPEPNHALRQDIEGVSVEMGKNLVLNGFKQDQKLSIGTPQSKHFKCTACHNVKREDPDLSKSDPEARLDFAQKNQLPFLQGTTLYGAVNRTSFYNDDYEKKYGDLVKPARNNLREAIQLCAVECSQGRRLKPVELESVLAYMWTLELKLSDLELDEAAFTKLRNAGQKANAGQRDEAMIDLLKSQYLAGSPAHFVKPPDDRREGAPFTGRPEKGKIIYELGCQHCHEAERYSFYNLDDSKVSFKHLSQHIPRYSRYSLYQVARYGTSPIPGKRAYMPQYSTEKMSDQQLEDLRAYIEQEAQR